MANNQPKIKPAQAKGPETPQVPTVATNTSTPPTPEVPEEPASPFTPPMPKPSETQEPGTTPPGETAQIPGTPMDQGTMQDQNLGDQPEERLSEVEQETEEETQREALLRAERIREKARKQLENLQKESESNVDSDEVTERRPAVAE